MQLEQLRTDENMRVIFAGGGTGGHIMPGAATAQALCELLPGTRCLFLHTARDSERHCNAAMAEFETMEIPAARWRGLVQKVRFAVTSVAAASQSVRVMRSFRPHVLVGLGGYSCVVPVLTAKALGVPTMIFESNAIPGRVVRLLAPVVDCVQLQWGLAADRLKAKRVLISGNPIRTSLLEDERRSARMHFRLLPDRCTLLVTGGSQGARELNHALAAALRHLTREAGHGLADKLQVLHLTGPEHLAEAHWTGLASKILYRTVNFTMRMQDAYAAADLVLARAGGSTLGELTALGLPSILVPYPHATDNHQSANAAVLVRAGAAAVLPQHQLTPATLAGLIADLVNNPKRRTDMGARAWELGQPQAARVVAAELAAMAGFELPAETMQQQGREQTVSLPLRKAA